MIAIPHTRPAPETLALALAGVCLLDLLSTLLLLHRGEAVEANPLLAWFVLRWGGAGLVAAKSAITLVALTTLEILRRFSPRVRLIMRAGVVLYLLLYIAGGLIVNR